MFFAYFIALFSGILWGGVTFLYSLLNNSYPISNNSSFILIILFFIDFIAFISVSFYIFFRKKNRISILTLSNKGMIFSCLAGILSASAMLCYLFAISTMNSSYIASISALYPIIGATFSYVLLKEKLSRYAKYGFLIAIFCSALLSYQYDNEFYILGGVLALCTAFGWGIEIAVSGYAMRYLKFHYVYLFRQLSSSILYLASFLTLFYIKKDIPDGINFNIKFILLGIISFSIISYYLYYRAIYYIKPIRAMILNITYGVWVVVFEYFFSNSNISISHILLSLGIVLGCVFVLRENV
ncbi:hypothetical protein B0186_06985 [Canicola haemoglobinophilus]|uniref:Protein LicB n=1 Tax=Canicola haemoglobinophilus TaxID=733 RepID=A0A1V4B0R9_9PAST|nr:DMT family transporter [Canicola haemoglobinophilus]OOS00102.1 hypothetical protein B0186_06985 [Canicola haemoglobinophilus]STO53770.1 protein LicB [Canicola haemoglobinophilus]STO60799.1 protein LicB [Canicola haemoglobinophilus]STO68303.1 protein LicB [Canicola haemoglobinophilus]